MCYVFYKGKVKMYFTGDTFGALENPAVSRSGYLFGSNQCYISNYHSLFKIGFGLFGLIAFLGENILWVLISVPVFTTIVVCCF